MTAKATTIKPELTAEKQKENLTTKTPRHEEKHEGVLSGISIRPFLAPAQKDCG